MMFGTQPRSCCPPGRSADELNNNDGDGDDEDKSEDAGEKPAPKKHATQNSSETLEPTPRQMGFYRRSAAWTDILESAKHEYRLYIHTRKAFPVRNLETLQRVGLCVTEAIAAHVNNPDVLEELDDSKCFQIHEVYNLIHVDLHHS
jgi:hypothetical protein